MPSPHGAGVARSEFLDLCRSFHDNTNNTPLTCRVNRRTEIIMENKPQFSFRIRPDLRTELQKASKGPYAPSMTAIIERGIELALRELKTKKAVAVQQ